MKKITKEFRAMDEKKLEKEVWSLRSKIAKTILSQKSSPAKDTNTLAKKRKKLAVLLTVLSDKKVVKKI